MAITKIHPIKTTLSLSIDYICDSNKTDEQILITSHKCGHKTAYLQFEETKKSANSSSINLARHLIQAFGIDDDITPEQAHKIGNELCEKHLKGKYEYVLTTHIDKGHIHNHIIFNNVSYVTGKSYQSNKRSYHEIRNISDELCKANGLSIVDESTNNKTKGQSYKEYTERKKGNSYKAKLQYTIDLAIRKAKDWEHFLQLMRSYGYEIKDGKHIAFRAKGQERFTRAKTIGEDYTEDKIKERISDYVTSKAKTRTPNNKKQTRVIDISSNELAQKSEGFARWIKLQNLKNMSKTWNEISNNGATSIDEFHKKVNEVYDELGEIQNKLKAVETEISETADKIKNIKTYKKYKSTFAGYQKADDKDAYFRLHEAEIILFEAAREALGKPITRELLSYVSKLQDRLAELETEVSSLEEILQKQKIMASNFIGLKNNLSLFLNKSPQSYYNQHIK